MPTPKQLEALNAIAAGQVQVRSVGGAPTRIIGSNHLVVGSVVAQRWASWPEDSEGICELTAAGLAILAEARRKQATHQTQVPAKPHPIG